MTKGSIVRGNAALGARLGIAASAVAFAADVAVLAGDALVEGLPASTAALGALVAAAYYGLVALAAAALGAASAAYAGGSRGLAPVLEGRLEALRGGLLTGDPGERRAFVARLVSRALALALAAAFAVPVARMAVEEIRTPVYAAAVSVAAGFAGLALAAIAGPLLRRTGDLLAAAAPRPPRPAAVIGAISLLAVTAAGAAIARTWDTFGFALPWRGPLLLVAFAAVFTAAVAAAATPSSRARLRRVPRPAGAGALALVAAGTCAFVWLPGSQVGVNSLLARSTGPISAVHALVSRHLDFDGDGYLSFLGQGDCAPFDAGRNPSARDIARDGVDQNCDGKDRFAEISVPPGRHDYPLDPVAGPMAIVLVTVDAASADHLDLYGYERATMPRLARRAATGVVFERAFSFGPSTRLTFPSMMTGRFMTQIRHKPKPRAHGAWEKGNVTLAEILGKAGYATHAIAADPYFSKTTRWIYQGFATVDDAPARAKRGLSATLVTDAGLSALDGLAGKDRFFLWLHYMDAHMAGGDYRIPAGLEPFPGGRGVDRYDTKLLVIDGELDRFLAGIDARLGGRPRLVIVTADHGESYDEKHAIKAHHGWDLSTSVTNVPLVVWSPWTRIARSRRLTSSLDLAPTILNAVGLRAAGMEGDSLLPTILGEADPGRPILQQMFIPEFIAQGKAPLTRVALRHGDMVLHRAAQVNELYDYASDRAERRNLFAERPEQAESMMEVMDALLRRP